MPPSDISIESYQDSLQIKENTKKIEKLFQVLEDYYLKLSRLETMIMRCKNEINKRT